MTTDDDAATSGAQLRDRIRELDARCHAFTQVLDWTPVRDGPLSGRPVAVKDNIDVAGVVTSLGRPLPEHRAAESDAPVVASLRAAGADLVGKTNLPEFASSAVTRNATFGDAVLPWAPERTVGGSSGGSAVAVATELAFAALATDTAGSALIPAALTGTCGLRPTVGTLPLEGIAALAPSLDTLGIIARTPGDLRSVLAELLVGDGTGPTTRVGVLGGWFADADTGVAELVAGVAHELSARPVELRGAERAGVHARTVYAVEAATSLSNLTEPGIRYADTVARRRTHRHTRAAVADAYAARADWQREVVAVFDAVDVLLMATTPTTAPRFDEDDETVSTRLVRNTYPFCFAGVPMVSVPAGTVDGLPVGVTLVGPPGGEHALLDAAARIHTGSTTRSS